MVRYFYDLEFLEGDVPCQFKGFNIPKWLIKPNKTIQPISIGIVSEDGREFYAVFNDFNLKEAWNRFDLKNHKVDGFPNDVTSGTYKVYWLRDNVLKPIFDDLVQIWALEEEKANRILCSTGYNPPIKFTYKNLKELLKKYGKSTKQIADEIVDFVSNDYVLSFNSKTKSPEFKTLYGNSFETLHNIAINRNSTNDGWSVKKSNLELWGYYSSYDRVCLAQLFGKMINLPANFPMYTRDLKQELDKYFETESKDGKIPYATDNGWVWVDSLKQFPDYPKEENAHSAIHDARFNKKLYEFLENL